MFPRATYLGRVLFQLVVRSGSNTPGSRRKAGELVNSMSAGLRTYIGMNITPKYPPRRLQNLLGLLDLLVKKLAKGEEE